MVGKELADLDRMLIAAVDQRDAFAFETDEGNFGQRLGGHREQRRHLRPGPGGVGRPAGGLAHVGERQRAGAVARDFGEQRRLLRAADNDVVARLGSGAKTFDLGAAELVCGLQLRATATARQRIRVERHGVFAGTHQDGAFFRHFGSGFEGRSDARSPRHPLGYSDPNLKVKAPTRDPCRPEHA